MTFSGRGALAVALGVAAACATPGQVRNVQTQVMILQRDQQRADSAHAAELRRLLDQQQRAVDSIMNVLSGLGERLSQTDRNNQAAFDELRREVYTTNQVLNVSQQKLGQIRAQIDATLTPRSGGDSGSAVTDVTIFEVGQRELNASHLETARSAFRDLLNQYGTSALVPDALFGMGNSFDPAEPDSARYYYDQVYTRFPTSRKASLALYKRGMMEDRANNSDAAKRFFQMIVDKYPNSEEYDLACSRVRCRPQ